jgi:hypothetical protein
MLWNSGGISENMLLTKWYTDYFPWNVISGIKLSLSLVKLHSVLSVKESQILLSSPLLAVGSVQSRKQKYHNLKNWSRNPWERYSE